MRVKVCVRPLVASESCEGLRSEWTYIIVGLLALGHITTVGLAAGLSTVYWQQLSQRHVSHGLRGALA